MKRRPYIPKFKEKVFIICEGVGDKIYLEKVISFYETKYDIRIISSGGKAPLFKCVIYGVGNMIYKIKDGVYIFPITSLKK